MRALAFLALVQGAAGLKWAIDQVEVDVGSALWHTEYFVYGSDEGPWPFSKGESYMEVDVAATLPGDIIGYNVTVLWVKTETILDETSLTLSDPTLDFCNLELLSTLLDQEGAEIVAYASSAAAVAGGAAAAGSGAPQVASLARRVPVTRGSLYQVFFLACPGSAATPSFADSELGFIVDGSVTYRNPYGFLPAVAFGELPFEVARTIAFLLVGVAFGLCMLRHRRHLKALHHSMLGVVGVATVEALCWSVLRLQMNASGAPECCPFPPAYGAAAIFDVLRATSSRCLLLCQCLGLGVAVDRLEKRDAAGVATITVAFLACGVAFAATDLSIAAGLRPGESYDAKRDSNVWELPWVLLNVGFLAYIYVALTNTMQALKSTGQTYKLGMYMNLAKAIFVVFLLFFLMFAVVVAGEVANLQYPWTMLWWQLCAWKLINFVAITAVMWIWRPDERTFLLVLSAQLPTEDDEDLFSADVMAEEVEMGPAGFGVRPHSAVDAEPPSGEFRRPSFTIGDGDDDDDLLDDRTRNPMHGDFEEAHL